MTIYVIIRIVRYRHESLHFKIKEHNHLLSKQVRPDWKQDHNQNGRKIGTYDEIKEKCGDMEPLEWAKEYAAKRSAEEKAAKQDVIMKCSSSMLIDKNVRRSCNAGYLFLLDIYYSLGIDKICAEISEKYKFEYDLNEILSMLVCSRIIAPGSKRSSLEEANGFVEQPKCSLHQIYRALEVIAKENDFSSRSSTRTPSPSQSDGRMSSTTTAPTTTLKSRTRMISVNTVSPRSTARIRLSRWGSS